MQYAYARVSAQDQNLARQLNAFREFGISAKQIYCDKKSGKDFERAAYKKLLHKLKKGDLLIIKSLDRLGRNYDAVIREWSYITSELGTDILVLDMPLLDTRTKPNTLVGRFISDIVLQVLSFVAENERMNIRARQAEGIRAAKANGVRFGRPKKIYSAEFKSVIAQYRNGQLTQTAAAKLVGMSRQGFVYHAKRIDI